MKKSKLLVLALLVSLTLSSCAPIILGRTPQPAAPGAFEFSLNAGYPFLSPYPNDPFNGPVQAPFAQPFNLFLARGVGGNTEVSGTLSINILPSLRFGGKTLLVEGSVPLAVDYGLTWFPTALTVVGADAGVLVSYPLPGVEPYGALRGFITSLTDPSFRRLTGALTLGADMPAGSGNFFIELTAATTTFDGTEYYNVPPIGFFIVPALGYRF